MRKFVLGALTLAVAVAGLSVGCKGKFSSSDCTPQCSGKACGSDGCGGICGECAPGLQCASDGQCASTFCGNGLLEPNEQCDNAITSGAGACPTECTPSDNACVATEFFGSAQNCDAQCKQTVIRDCVSGDGCCPDGCSDNDSDCSLTCDNGTIDDNETCDPPSTCPTDPATDCPAPSDACKTAEITGSATSCAAACVEVDVTACVDDDGCCPSGCGIDDDNDCEFECGDGVVSGPELCDSAIAAGDEGACPAAPADCGAPPDACTMFEVVGSADDCTAGCATVTITDFIDGDGCCPAGGTPANDDDCDAVCGNGVVETGETCDSAITAPDAGACPDAAACNDNDACTTDALVGSAALCTAECTNTAITTATAGDGCCYFAGPVSAEIDDCQSHCDDYCAAAIADCADFDGAGSSLYGDMAECQTACAAFGFAIRQAASTVPADDAAVDTLFCRLNQLALAASSGDAATHCPAAAATSSVCN